LGGGCPATRTARRRLVGGRRREAPHRRDVLPRRPERLSEGKCVYCFSDVSVLAGDAALSDVDHFFPRGILGSVPSLTVNLDGVWNLVLACRGCTRRICGKMAGVPGVRFLERLHRRNSYPIDSPHPLLAMGMNQTAPTELDRRRFRQQDRVAISALIHGWVPADELAPAF
jgi:hypothetical protein